MLVSFGKTNKSLKRSKNSARIRKENCTFTAERRCYRRCNESRQGLLQLQSQIQSSVLYPEQSLLLPSPDPNETIPEKPFTNLTQNFNWLERDVYSKINTRMGSEIAFRLSGNFLKLFNQLVHFQDK